MKPNNGRTYPKPRERKARPALESKERASVPKEHEVMIPRDLPDVLFVFGCAAAFFVIPAAISILLRAGSV